MRIVLSVPWFFPQGGGGGQTYALQISRELKARGHDIHILSGMKWEGGEGEFRLVPYEYMSIPVQGLQINPHAQRWEDDFSGLGSSLLAGLSEGLDLLKPDLVHLNGFKPALTSLCVKRRIPFVVTAHHPGVVCPAGLRCDERGAICTEVASPKVCVRCCCIQRSHSRLAGNILATLPDGLSRKSMWASDITWAGGKVVRALAYPAVIRDSLRSKAMVWEQAPCWIAPSKAMRDYLLRQGVTGEKVKLIPHGMEPVMSVPEVRIKNGLVRFGYLGGFNSVKGLHTLLESAQRLLHPERCEIHVFGMASSTWTIDYRSRTVDRYCGKAKLVLHDPLPRERMAEAYSEFDVLIVPSNCPEAFGLVILEAFTAGRPVVVSDAGGLPELVRHEIDGLIVPVNDPEALAAAMQKMLDNPNLISQLASNILPVRTIPEHVDELEKVYQSLA